MDRDGFSLSFRNTNGVSSRVVSLALAGVSAKAGTFPKSTDPAPADQSIAGVGFRPELILLSSFEGGPEVAPVAHARFALGAADGTRQACSSLSDTSGLPVSGAGSIDLIDRLFLKTDHERSLTVAAATLIARDADSFTLRWLANDMVPAQLTYLTLGALP
jgi:hypothetical protein